MATSKTTYTKTLRDWEELLAAAAEHAPIMPEVEDLRAQLEQHATRAKALKVLKDSARANRQGLTQQLDEELVKGREVAMRIRGIAKARVGPKNERIVQFGVAPLRKRNRRKKTSEPVPPPTQPPAAPAVPALPVPLAVTPPQKGGESPTATVP
jgi:hypothetical protein